MNSSNLAAGSSRLLSRLLVCACLSGVSPLAAQLATPVKPTPEQISKYDKNKNGVLDPEEIRVMQAEAKPAVDVPASRAGEEVVELSPFQVVADNHGYLASNTMSGTRMNAKIEDLGAAITVRSTA